MPPFWVTLKDDKPGCVTAPDERAAKAIAKRVTGKEPLNAMLLPHAARPRLNPEASNMPSACQSPVDCAGYTTCPKTKACSPKN